MNVAGTLVRRGFEAHAYVNSGDKKAEFQLPAWGAVMLASTAVIFFGVMFMIEYTFGRVIPTLLVIESPQENIDFTPLPTDDTDATINKNPTSPELETIKPQPITSSFRRSIKHLQAIGGFRARFRGLAAFIANHVAIQWIAGMISIAFIPRAISNILAAVACAQLSLLWTQIVISEPSPKTWFRRMPAMKTWKKVAGPTAVLAAAEQIAVFVPLYIAILSGVTKSAEELQYMSPNAKQIMVVKGFFISLLGLVLAACIVIPANVALTRVQASLLDDSEETIVPFDRSFGGKVVPEIVGGSGVIGMLDAWKTFEWAGRIRLVKAYAKVFAMQIAVSFLFFAILVAQVCLIVGKDWSKLIPKDGDKN